MSKKKPENAIVSARKHFRDRLADDIEFRGASIDLISALIYDDQRGQKEGRTDQPALNLSDWPGCREIAGKILDKLFSTPIGEAPEAENG